MMYDSGDDYLGQRAARAHAFALNGIVPSPAPRSFAYPGTYMQSAPHNLGFPGKYMWHFCVFSVLCIQNKIFKTKVHTHENQKAVITLQ